MALVESPSGYSVTDSAIIDSKLAVWMLIKTNTVGNQITRNGVIQPYSANVQSLTYSARKVYQKNANGDWWFYDDTIADWIAAGKSPLTPPVVTAPPVTLPPGTLPPVTSIGPVATGSLATVDFGAPTGRKAPKELWGIAAGFPNDYNFKALNDATFMAAAAQIMPSLYRINCNSGGNGYWSDQIFAKGANNPDWTLLAPLIDNGYKFIGPNCRLIIGLRFEAFSVNDYAIVCRQIATHIKTTNGGNGKPLPVWGWEIGNENDKTDINTYCQYFNAAADAFHAVDLNYKVIGTIDSYVQADRLNALAQKCGTKVGALCYHNYMYCAGSDPVPTDRELLTAARPANDAKTARSAVAGTVLTNTPIFMGEWNMECAAQDEQRQQQPIGAVFAANWMLAGFNANVGVEMGALWEMGQDGAYGVIQNGLIKPVGWFLGKAGASMGGDEVSAKFTNAGGSHNILAILNGSKVGVMIINYDTVPMAGTIGLSRMPAGGSLRSWLIGNSNPVPLDAAITVARGIITVVVPAMSVMIVSR